MVGVSSLSIKEERKEGREERLEDKENGQKICYAVR